ncbi:MAG: DsbC family protein [Thermodesulfobacteriota bacterium]
MKKFIVCILFITVLLAADISLAFQSTAGCGKDGCKEDCTSCHTLSTEEASKILKTEVTDVKMSPVKGLWEVEGVQDGRKFIVHIDIGKKYVVLINRIIDIENIGKPPELKKINISLIPLENAVIAGDPKAKQRIIVFDDPDCPYCKRFHEDIKKILKTRQDIAFYIKLFPLTEIHPEAYEKSKAIVCKRSLKLLEDAFAGKELPKPDCETDEVDKNIALAKTLGISGTPAIILPDGGVIPGYVDAPTLLNILDATQQAEQEKQKK